MTKANDFEMYQEYCHSMQALRFPTEQVLKDNLERFRQEHRQKTQESGRHFINCRHKEYDQKLAKVALANCKSKKEWQDMEADYRRVPDWLVVTHISAQESLELYIGKINRSYRAENWYMAEIKKCEQAIYEINHNTTISQRSKSNRMEHWQTRRANYLIKLHIQVAKTHRLESLVMKWRGVCEKIRLAEIAKEIKAEKRGIGNKYGFNPNMRDRSSATDIFDED